MEVLAYLGKLLNLARSGQIPLVTVKGRADLDKPWLAIAQVGHYALQIKIPIRLENIARHKLQWGAFKAGWVYIVTECHQVSRPDLKHGIKRHPARPKPFEGAAVSAAAPQREL